MLRQFRDYKYFVNEDGIVVNNNGLIMKPNKDKDGYLTLNLFSNEGYKHFKVHRMVAECFIVREDDNLQVNHIDGDKLNNTVENLEWVTNSYNVKHAYDIGLIIRGEGHHLAVLTNSIVEKIKLKLMEGLRDIDIAKEFKIERKTISNIRLGKTWKHIRPELSIPLKSSGLTKLNAEDIPIIRDLYKIGYSQEAIGREFNVCGGTISGVLRGKTWTNY